MQQLNQFYGFNLDIRTKLIPPLLSALAQPLMYVRTYNKFQKICIFCIKKCGRPHLENLPPPPLVRTGQRLVCGQEGRTFRYKRPHFWCKKQIFRKYKIYSKISKFIEARTFNKFIFRNKFIKRTSKRVVPARKFFGQKGGTIFCGRLLRTAPKTHSHYLSVISNYSCRQWTVTYNFGLFFSSSFEPDAVCSVSCYTTPTQKMLCLHVRLGHHSG